MGNFIAHPPHLYDVTPWLQRAHGAVVAVWLPMMLMTMCLSSFFAYVGARNSTYDDPSEHWQACYNRGGSMTIPLSEAADMITELLDNLRGFADAFCAFNPIPPPDEIDLSGLVDIAMPISSLAAALSYQGIQTIMFTTFAHATAYRAWSHPSWFASSIVFVFWACFATLTYYTVSPLLPVPVKINSTMLVLMRYSTPSTFDALGDKAGDCDTAYSMVWLYLGGQLVMAASVFSLSILLGIGEYCRQNTPNRKYYAQLANTVTPTLVIALSMIGYLLFASAKADSSFLAIRAIADYDNDEALRFNKSFFPFQGGSFDISTILFILSFMSVCRGYSRQSVSSFRLAAATSALYFTTAFPGVVAGISFYRENEFYNDDKCRDFFRTGGIAASFGYPSKSQATHYCSDFRLALAAGITLFASMILQTIACARTFTANMHRPSGIFDPLDPREENPANPINITGLSHSVMEDPDKALYKA